MCCLSAISVSDVATGAWRGPGDSGGVPPIVWWSAAKELMECHQRVGGPMLLFPERVKQKAPVRGSEYPSMTGADLF